MLLSGLPFNWAIQVSKDLSKQGTQVALEVADRRLLGVIEETSREFFYKVQ